MERLPHRTGQRATSRKPPAALAARRMIPGWVFSLLVAASGGCGSGESGGERFSGEAIPVPSGQQEGGLPRHEDQTIPIISISKIDGELVYRVHDDPVSRSELDRLAANIASYSPDITVILMPGPTITEDETGLVRSRLEEAGLQNVRTASASARE